MMPKKFTFRWPCVAIAVFAMVTGCSSSRGSYAPVVEKQVQREIESGIVVKKPAVPLGGPVTKAPPRFKESRSQTHIIQKGDTLYSIAFSYGLDHREIAELNNIQNYDLIQVGRELRLPSAGSPIVTSAPSIPIVSAMTMNTVESRPLEASVISQPKVVKPPYSEQTAVRIEKEKEGQKSEITAPAKVQVRSEIRTEPRGGNVADEEDGSLEWIMPTSGKIINEFSEISGSKGIDIAGKLGQPIIASSAGKVVYCGNGLRGYGKLIIIKHNKTYLSAYAHNEQLLVKEGQNVSKGQKIAEMGNTDSDQVKLHFEIRRFGKPVDPAKYLPITTS